VLVCGIAGYLDANMIRAYALRHRCVAVGFDMPGHGRSDGLFVYVPDWSAVNPRRRLATPRHATPTAAPAAPYRTASRRVTMQSPSPGRGFEFVNT
jgi:hypothetical protein